MGGGTLAMKLAGVKSALDSSGGLNRERALLVRCGGWSNYIILFIYLSLEFKFFMASPVPAERFFVSEIFFFAADSLHSALRLYENTFQFLSCDFHGSPSNSESTSSPQIPSLALAKPLQRYYLHSAIELSLLTS